MLLGIFGKETENVDNKFSDVDENKWYAPYVNTAADMGIVSGIEEDIFGDGRKNYTSRYVSSYSTIS